MITRVNKLKFLQLQFERTNDLTQAIAFLESLYLAHGNLGPDITVLGARGCGAGLLGPRNEQFALGSVYYFINYGMQVYEDEPRAYKRD